MSLTDEALEVLTTCYLAEQVGKTYAPHIEEWRPAEEATEKGWLERELRDEHVAYRPTQAGHTALHLNSLRRNEPADQN